MPILEDFQKKSILHKETPETRKLKSATKATPNCSVKALQSKSKWYAKGPLTKSPDSPPEALRSVV